MISSSSDVALLVGQVVGNYRIRRVIGSGGMGAVYEATQEHTLQTVALKVMKLGAATGSALRRFEYEVEFMGRLHHPGIARIYEAGTHRPSGATGELGLPYFAMEYIADARTILEHAMAHQLGTRARLELMTLVCESVHYGHQNGVLHRDLKPTNILVDGAGHPKVIDFGVARATDSDRTAATLTEGGELIGTLRYMSPEQCMGDQKAIDTRSDVYALGVVLYELLTGRFPYDLDNGPAFEAPRIIREVQPNKLSSIDRSLRGDVETIVHKALEKDREQRYGSASELATDLRRFLGNEPIRAHPPSVAYQLKQFAKRNKTMVVAVCAIVIALFAGITTTSLALVDANRQRDEALRQTYVANIAAADAAIEAGEGGSARMRLVEAAESLRGWEWRYLMRRADDSLETVAAPGDGPAMVAISPDESRVLIERGSDTGSTLTMRDVATGTVAWSRNTNESAGRACFSRDGSKFATATPQKNGVRVCSTASGETSGQLTGPVFRSLCFDSDARRIWTGDEEGRVRLWDIESQRVLRELPMPDAIAIDLSPDGTRLALSGATDTVVLDVASGTVERRLPLPPDASAPNFMTVRFSPDGSLLAVANELAIQLFEVPSWSERPVRRGHSQRIFSLAFSPDGATLASGSLDQTIRLWNVATGEQSAIRRGHANLIRSLGFFDRGTRVLSGDDDGVVKVFDATSSSDPAVIDLGPESGCQVCSISFGRGSRLVLCSAYRASIWDLDARSSSLDIPPNGEGIIFATGFSPDERTFAAGHRSGEVSVSDAQHGTVLWKKPGHRGNVNSIEYAPDGWRLASAADDGTIRIWEVATGRVLLVIQGHVKRIQSIKFNSDGTRLASTSTDGTAKIWDVRGGSQIAVFRGHRVDVNSVSFDPEGTRVASVSSDQTTQIWDAATGRSLKVLSGVNANIWSVAFSPDGSRLATGSQDGLVRLWDPNTGQVLLVLRGHTRSVMSLAWSPDGRRLLSGSYRGNVRVWDAPLRSESR